MSGSEPTPAPSRTTPAPATPSAAQTSTPSSTPASAMSLILPAVTAVTSAVGSVVESAAAVILPSAPAAASTANPGAAAGSEQTASASSEQPGFISWIAGKARAFFSAVGDHLGRLSEVRDFNGLCSWAKDAASDLWEGVKSVAHDVSHAVAKLFTGGGESHESHYAEASQTPGIIGEFTEQLTESAEFTSEAIAKRKEQLEELYEHLREAALEQGHGHGYSHCDSLPHETSHMAVRFAAYMIDPLTLGNLRLAILGNEIPPECMVEVRRLLAEVDAERMKNVS